MNDYPETEIATAGNAQRKRHKKTQLEKPTSILKLPFISDGLSRVVSRIVRKSRVKARVVFMSGPSLQDKFVRSTYT